MVKDIKSLFCSSLLPNLLAFLWRFYCFLLFRLFITRLRSTFHKTQGLIMKIDATKLKDRSNQFFIEFQDLFFVFQLKVCTGLRTILKFPKMKRSWWHRLKIMSDIFHIFFRVSCISMREYPSFQNPKRNKRYEDNIMKKKLRSPLKYFLKEVFDSWVILH